MRCIGIYNQCGMNIAKFDRPLHVPERLEGAQMTKAKARMCLPNRKQNEFRVSDLVSPLAEDRSLDGN